jgi:hypothetical protein
MRQPRDDASILILWERSQLFPAPNPMHPAQFGSWPGITSALAAAGRRRPRITISGQALPFAAMVGTLLQRMICTPVGRLMTLAAADSGDGGDVVGFLLESAAHAFKATTAAGAVPAHLGGDSVYSVLSALNTLCVASPAILARVRRDQDTISAAAAALPRASATGQSDTVVVCLVGFLAVCLCPAPTAGIPASPAMAAARAATDAMVVVYAAQSLKTLLVSPSVKEQAAGERVRGGVLQLSRRHQGWCPILPGHKWCMFSTVPTSSRP